MRRWKVYWAPFLPFSWLNSSLTLFFLWLRWVLVVAHRIFIEVCGLLVKARGLPSRCGLQAPGRVGSVVCGMWALSLRCASSVVVAHGLSCPAVCGILVPWPGIEPAFPRIERQILCHWTTREVPAPWLLNHILGQLSNFSEQQTHLGAC